MSYDSPYQPPKMQTEFVAAQLQHTGTPSVVLWYKVYCVCMALLYVLTLGMGIVFIAFAPELAEDDPALDDTFFLQIMGAVLVVVSLALVAVFGMAPFLPRKRWAWIYGFIPICIGLTSACTLIVCIPLLVFWLKAETKAYFGAT